MKFFFLALFTISTSTFAGERGNGGDVIVCRSSKGEIESVEMLDLYEGRELHGVTLDPSLSAENSLERNLFSVIDAIRWIGAPVRSHSYKKLVDAFFTEAEISHYGGLPDIPDHGDISLPENCTLEQVAIQENYPIHRFEPVKSCDEFFNLKPRYKIEKSLWDKMDTLNRAALIMHEIVYRDFLMGNAYFGRETKNSSSARYLVAVLFSFKQRRELTNNEFRIWLRKNLFFIQEFQGMALFSNSENSFHPNGSLKEGEANRYIPSFIKFERRMQNPAWHQVQYRFKLNESGSPREIYACSNIPVTNQLSNWEGRQSYPVKSYGEQNGSLTLASFENAVPGKVLGRDVKINSISVGDVRMTINLENSFELRHKNYELLIPAKKNLIAFKEFLDSGFELKDLRPAHINGSGRVFCASRNEWITVVPKDAVFFTDKNKVETIVSKEVIKCEE